VNDNDEQQRKAWHTATVSWGQFALAAAGILGAVVATVWIDRLAVDRRLTILEERQAYVLRELVNSDTELAMVRSDIARRLDTIQTQLVQITIDLARHQSVQKSNGN
jgi:hypothetical protein